MSRNKNGIPIFKNQNNVLKKILLIAFVLSMFVIISSSVALFTITLWKNSLNNVTPLQQLSRMFELKDDIRFRLTAVLSDRLPTVGSKNRTVDAWNEFEKIWLEYEMQQAPFYGEDPDYKKAKEGFLYTKNLVSELTQAYAADDLKKLGIILDEKWPQVILDFSNPLRKLYRTQTDNIKKTSTNSEILTKKFRFGLIGMLGCSLLVSIYALIFIFGFRARTEQIVKTISNLGSQVLDASHELNSNAASLDTVSDRNRHAIQETSAALEEINSIVQITATSTNRSQELTGATTHSIHEAEMSMSRLSTSMDNINSTTNVIVSQLDDVNIKLESFIKIFNEVADKTKVINDIVFQTRLLSFNASVEAARAGEHGRGFAVVAEEIGALARVSGNSAQEISKIINAGLLQVQEIANQVKAHSQEISKSATDSASEGVKSSHEISAAFELISNNVELIKAIMTELNLSTNEQTKGINEVTIAMQDINLSSEKSSKSVEATHSESARLKEQAEQLFQVMEDFEILLNGQKKVS